MPDQRGKSLMNLLKSLRGKRAFFRSKVARRIFLLFILCALIPLSALAYFTFSQVTKNLYSQANEDLHVASKASGMATFERLQFLETDLGMIDAILGQGKNDRMALSVPGLRERLRVQIQRYRFDDRQWPNKNSFGKDAGHPATNKG